MISTSVDVIKLTIDEPSSDGGFFLFFVFFCILCLSVETTLMLDWLKLVPTLPFKPISARLESHCDIPPLLRLLGEASGVSPRPPGHAPPRRPPKPELRPGLPPLRRHRLLRLGADPRHRGDPRHRQQARPLARGPGL